VHLHEPIFIGSSAVDDEEHKVVIVVELRALAEVLRVLQCEWMEMEDITKNREIPVRRLVKIDPEEFVSCEQSFRALGTQMKLADLFGMDDVAGRGRRDSALAGVIGLTNVVFHGAIGRCVVSHNRIVGPSRSQEVCDTGATHLSSSGVTLEELQILMLQTYGERDAARGTSATLAWLTEELGELARAVRKGTREEQLHELSDVLAWLASLANQLGLSLEEAVARYAAGCPKCQARPCHC
jgi:NTP pyrophosphatase (non-canonical NTP hydrolase)